MIPTKVLELAATGGYDLNQLDKAGRDTWEQHALDPDFWRGLSKALGWTDCNPCISEEGHRYAPIGNTGNYSDTCKHCKQQFKGEGWKETAHRFCNLILTGQPTEPFWAELLN